LALDWHLPSTRSGVTFAMSKPPGPDRPEVSVAGDTELRITWTIPQDADPEVTASTVKLRIVGSQRWQNYDHSTGRLVAKGGSTVPAPTCEVTVDGCEVGLGYEAIVAAMNSHGWSDVSEPSLPVIIGDPKPRAKPTPPPPPKLSAVGPGKLRCTWEIGEACPPIEASQLQLTAVSSGLVLLVDAANGRLVPSGRTTFAVPRCEASINGVEDGIEYVVAVCCRNAEGFGDYSLPSDPSVAGIDPRASTSGMELVLHDCSTQAPVLLPLTDGQMRVRWNLPEEAKSTIVKLRRVGDMNWYLCGGTAIAAPASETIARGLDEGIEYEAMASFLINGRWCGDTPVSSPGCIGDIKLPSTPAAPPDPRLFVLDVAACKARLKWIVPTTVPPVTGIAVHFRAVGGKEWQNVSPSGQITSEEVDLVSPSAGQLDICDLDQGVRYEAAIALRNKLGLGPFSGPSDVVCIGRPIPQPMKCMFCFNDFDLQHTRYTRNPENFWCPVCRFRHMDPFNAVIEPYGMLLCHIVARPTISFALDLPDLRSWRKDDHAVFMRMCRIDSDNCAQVWPTKLTLEANGNEILVIKEPEEGHVRRDVPKDISAGLKPGLNTIRIHMEDENLCGFALSLSRTQTRTAKQIATDIPICAEEAARERICMLLGKNVASKSIAGDSPAPDGEEGQQQKENDDDDEIVECVVSNKLKLRCPLSFERVVIPTRGEGCMHLQCFGLGAYLESNAKMRALNNRWTCPVCSCVLRPQDLRIDGYVERVLAETPPYIDEVEIMEGGAYRCIEEEDMPKAPPVEAAKVADQEIDAIIDGTADATIEAVIHAVDDGHVEKRKENSTMLQLPPAKKRQRRRQRMLSVADEGNESSN